MTITCPSSLTLSLESVMQIWMEEISSVSCLQVTLAFKLSPVWRRWSVVQVEESHWLISSLLSWAMVALLLFLHWFPWWYAISKCFIRVMSDSETRRIKFFICTTQIVSISLKYLAAFCSFCTSRCRYDHKRNLERGQTRNLPPFWRYGPGDRRRH